MRNLLAGLALVMALASPAVAAFDVRLTWTGSPNMDTFAEVIEVAPDGLTATLRTVKLDPALHPDGTYFTTLRVETAAVIRLYQRNGKYPFTCDNYSPPSEAVLVTPPPPSPRLDCSLCPK